jgi:alpha-amylase
MEFDGDKELITYLSKLGELRNEHTALTRGELVQLHEASGMAVYKRTYQDETIVVAINNTSKSQTVKINSKEFADDKQLTGLLSDMQVKEKSGQYQLTIDAETAEIFTVSEKSGLGMYPIAFAAGVILVSLLAFYVLRRSKRKITN